MTCGNVGMKRQIKLTEPPPSAPLLQYRAECSIPHAQTSNSFIHTIAYPERKTLTWEVIASPTHQVENRHIQRKKYPDNQALIISEGTVTMPHQTSILLLKSAALLIFGFGVLMVLSVFTPVEAIMELFVDLAFWPLDGVQTLDAEETRLMTGISGGVLAGWACMIYLLTRDIYAENWKVGGRMILISVGVWFVLDGIGSIMAGAPMNAFYNVVYLALVAGPVLLSRDPTKTPGVH